MSVLPNSAAEFIGLLGVCCYLSSYSLVQAGRLRGGTLPFTILNLTAAVCVLISLTAKFNLASLLIQIFWITVSLFVLIRLFCVHQRLRRNADLRRWANQLFPDMPERMAVEMLSLARLEPRVTGTTLTTTGTPVQAVCLIASGTAEVTTDDGSVVKLGPGELVGEIGFGSGAAAMATVRMAEPGQVFLFDASRMQKALAANSKGAQVFSVTAFASAGRKLDAMNRRRAPSSPIPVAANEDCRPAA